jgi:hypothetical protein
VENVSATRGTADPGPFPELASPRARRALPKDQA